MRRLMIRLAEPIRVGLRSLVSLRTSATGVTRRFVNAVVMRPISAANYLLSSVAVVLLVLVLGEVIFPTQLDTHFLEEAEKAWNPPEIQKPSRKPFAFYRQELSQKNLFRSKTQRNGMGRSPSKSSLAEDQREVLSRFELVGIVSGKDAVAIIKCAGSEGSIHYRVGDVIDGFSVTQIEKSRVVLSRGGRDYHLKL